MTHHQQQCFLERDRKALDLGRRMAESGFSLQDNPFDMIHPRFATQWSRGFLAVNTLRCIASARLQNAVASRKGLAAAS